MNKVDDIAERLPLVEEKIENMSYKIQLLTDILPTSLEKTVAKPKSRKIIHHVKTDAATPLSKVDGECMYLYIFHDIKVAYSVF
jgi:hypothetical protein